MRIMRLLLWVSFTSTVTALHSSQDPSVWRFCISMGEWIFKIFKQINGFLALRLHAKIVALAIARNNPQEWNHQPVTLIELIFVNKLLIFPEFSWIYTI